MSAEAKTKILDHDDIISFKNGRTLTRNTTSSRTPESRHCQTRIVVILLWITHIFAMNVPIALDS
jgi:hypothetical protein